jgi:hypothetical protein
VRAPCRSLAVRAALLGSLCLGAVAVAATPSAQAYTHGWSCARVSADPCYDTTGTTFNSWVFIHASMSATSSHVCAKGVTALGNVRQPETCQTGTTESSVCYVTGGTPDTHAFVYWDGPGTTRTINGDANTLVC